MSASLKEQILDGIWQVADRHDYVVSATVTGSFIDKASLEGISDIDCVVIVDHLNKQRFEALKAEFSDTLTPLLQAHGYALRLNPTLGPLKFNEPNLAVLHLMLYSETAHVDHVLKSPFTCLDWQRSPAYRKRSLADVFPVIGLQPRHFVSSRRSMLDYLKDFNARSISYRELVCMADGYSEQARHLPMNERDRHEFAYHVIRFLMGNLIKLLHRTNRTYSGEMLLERYFAVFPAGRSEFGDTYLALKHMKDRQDFSHPMENLDDLLHAFIEAFERQFRRMFVDNATRHFVCRHAPTPLNGGAGEKTRFVGRLDPDLAETADSAWHGLAAALHEVPLCRTFISPAKRARQTIERLSRLRRVPAAQEDERLHEINYGELEGHTVHSARAAFPHIFSAWSRGEDPRLPGGESVSDVQARVQQFIDEYWAVGEGSTLVCTHNVVLRCLLGMTLGLKESQWHRLRIPHLTPFTFIQTAAYGLFVDIEPNCERALLAPFHRSLAG